MKLCLIDYGMGNLASVRNAFHALGAPVEVVLQPQDLALAEAILLPGVGAFGAGMDNLRRRGFVPALAEAALGRRAPLLGICLGMQLLADMGSEHGEHAGLGFLPGRVDRLARPEGDAYRLPHIGWNDLQIRRRDGLFADIPEGENFYFVHSYVFHPAHPAAISATCQHGVEFVASLEWGNLSAVQFHPEKSHKAGLKLLRNWLNRVKSC